MDLVDLITEKRFLGQEFLTWLWYKSEERGGSVELPSYGDIIVVFEKHMLLESGEGESHEKLICRGLQTELTEARTGLLVGKKPEQARIQIVKGEFECSFTLSATLFELRSVKVPKTLSESEEGEEREAIEGRILDRMGMLDEVTKTVHELFRLFLEIRLGDSWPGELGRIRSWVRQAAAQ